MKLEIIGSSSSGNCYVLQNDHEAIIIELGCKIQAVKKAVNWNLGKVKCAIVSHSHNDHAAFAKDAAAAGILVMASEETLNEKSLYGEPFTLPISAGVRYKCGGFFIQPFNVHHDVLCYGYIIYHEEMGKMLFVTDTVSMGYTINGLNHILIEANYSDEIVDRNIESGKLNYVLRSRLLNSHMELQSTKLVLSRQNLSEVQNIVLIHLSSGNSDPDMFKQEIINCTGKCVHIAKPGLEIDVSKTPY